MSQAFGSDLARIASPEVDFPETIRVGTWTAARSSGTGKDIGLYGISLPNGFNITLLFDKGVPYVNFRSQSAGYMPTQVEFGALASEIDKVASLPKVEVPSLADISLKLGT